MNMKLFKDVNYMALSQAANYVLPLILIPYLVRTIGLSAYGSFAVAQAAVNVGIIAVQFGLNIYATKEISEKIKDGKSITSTISQAIFLQIILAIFLMASSATVAFINPNNLTTLVGLFSLSLLGQALYPTWYFQGSQKFNQLATLNVILRSGIFILTLSLVKSEEDLILLPAIYSFWYIATGSIAAFIMLSQQKFITPKLSDIVSLMKSTKDIFYSSLLSSLLMNMPFFFLGGLVSKPEVGSFSALLRTVYAAKGILTSGLQVLIPALASGSIKTSRSNIVKNQFFILIGIFILSMLLKDPLQELLYGRGSNLNNDTVYTLLFLSIIPGSLATLFLLVFASVNAQFKQRRNSFIIAISASLALYNPLIANFGTIGASIVILTCEVILLFMGYMIFKDSLKNEQVS